MVVRLCVYCISEKARHLDFFLRNPRWASRPCTCPIFLTYTQRKNRNYKKHGLGELREEEAILHYTGDWIKWAQNITNQTTVILMALKSQYEKLASTEVFKISKGFSIKIFKKSKLKTSLINVKLKWTKQMCCEIVPS